MSDDTMTVEIDKDLATRLNAAAIAEGIPVEAFVREALTSHLDWAPAWGDDPNPSIDEAILDDAEQTGGLVTLDEVDVWMRSWFTGAEQPSPFARAR
jgi:predicted transcriptional regulator